MFLVLVAGLACTLASILISVPFFTLPALVTLVALCTSFILFALFTLFTF